MKTTQFRNYVLSKITNNDFNFSLNEVKVIMHFSRTSSGNASSGVFAKWLGIPADEKSIEIWRGVKGNFSMSELIGFLSIQNYVKIISKPFDYDSKTRQEFTKDTFKKTYGLDFDYVFKKK